jgi:hypothetical protein
MIFKLNRHHQFRHCEQSEAIQGRKKDWIASSRSLSSGAHSRDPLAPRNDEAVAATRRTLSSYLSSDFAASLAKRSALNRS